MQKSVDKMLAFPLYEEVRNFIRSCGYGATYNKCPRLPCKGEFSAEDPKTLLVNVIDHLQEQHGL